MRIIVATEPGVEAHFFAPDPGGYIYLEQGKFCGTEGQQICRGGRFEGYTLWAADMDDLKSQASEWLADRGQPVVEIAEYGEWLERRLK